MGPEGATTMSSERYEICKQFTAGYAACLAIQHRDVIGQSAHWLAGWDAAWPARQEKNRQLDAYLVSIGHEPQLVITLA